MTDNTLPPSGLTLVHDQPASSHRKDVPQVIQLNLIDSVSRDILKSIRNSEQVRLRLGKKPAVQYGKRSIILEQGSDNFPSDLFSGPSNGTEHMYFSGRLNHTLEVQRAKEATAKSDEALAALENTLKTMQEQRASNEAMVKTKDAAGRRDPKSVLSGRERLLVTTTPSSPFLSAGRSPGFGPTSAPVLSATQTKDKIRLDAMRIPILHLLAIRPMTSDDVARTLNASKEECEKVLEKVSRETNGSRELKDKSYRDLDVWKFPYHTDADRQKAINHAIHAYDRTRLDRNDILWQLLLPKHDRGKGKVLSRLNFDKPIVPPKPTVPADKDAKGDVSDREAKPKRPKTAKDILPKKKVGDDGKTKVSKPQTKAAPKAPKQESKFKSSERIENSDEEAEAASRTVVKPIVSANKFRDKERDRPLTSASPAKAQGHRPRLSQSSSSSAEVERQAKPVEREKLKPRPRAENTNSKISPRPRKDSSPQKPSPLGSSPPTNSTDLEESSKGSTQSSAPSSPPSSNEIPLAQQRRTFSPVIDAKARGTAKRKAERSDDERPMKKHQSGAGGLDSLPRSLTSQLQHPTPERRSSESSTSSPEKSKVTKQEVIQSAKYFTSSYGKYRDLYDKLSRLPSKQREDKEIDRLWSMHKRLEEMKTAIWQDWAKVGGGD